MDEGAGGAVAHREGAGAGPGEFEHGTERILRRAADGAGCEYVADAHVAAADGVVRQLLGHVPVHVPEVGAADGVVVAVGGADDDLEVDVVVLVAVGAQVGQHGGYLLGAGYAERLQRLQHHHPRRHGGGEIFAEERPQRHVFPLLDVARRPVVEEHHTEDVIGGLGGGNGLPERIFLADDEGHFQLKVEAGAGLKDGRGFALGHDLPHGAAHGRAADDDGRRPPVVADGEVSPVGEQGVFGVAEHLADVGGVLDAGVEVGVVANPDGQEHAGIGHGHEGVGVKGERRLGVAEPRLHAGAHAASDGLAEGDECVEVGLVERPTVEAEVCEQPLLGEFAEVNNLVADGDAGAMVALRGGEYAKRQVVDAKAAARGGGYPSLHGCWLSWAKVVFLG